MTMLARTRCRCVREATYIHALVNAQTTCSAFLATGFALFEHRSLALDRAAGGLFAILPFCPPLPSGSPEAVRQSAAVRQKLDNYWSLHNPVAKN
jgi:hypothetical protein